MAQVIIRCYGQLNDFLPRAQRHRPVVAATDGHESVKNVVEALGVPHPELEALLVNGGGVDFSYLVQPDDIIDAYPPSALPDSPFLLLRPPLTQVHFVLDAHLGRLAAYLRLLGFDTLYRNDYDDAHLARLAHDERRILLTRDLGLLKRSLVIYGYFVRATLPLQQLHEVVQRFSLQQTSDAFQRCTRCNALTQRVEKDSITHLLEPRTRQYYEDFQQCQGCGQIYWQGSHYERMRQVIGQACPQVGPP